MKKFQSSHPWRYYTIMLWCIGALTIGYAAVIIYKGTFNLQGIGSYLCAVGAIIPMRSVAYKYVAMDSEAIYITDKEPNSLTQDRILLSKIERVELHKAKWNELGRYVITIKQIDTLYIETRQLGRISEAEVAKLIEAIAEVGIEAVIV